MEKHIKLSFGKYGVVGEGLGARSDRVRWGKCSFRCNHFIKSMKISLIIFSSNADSEVENTKKSIDLQTIELPTGEFISGIRQRKVCVSFERGTEHRLKARPTNSKTKLSTASLLWTLAISTTRVRFSPIIMRR
jgi:hypothetical protein